MKVWVIETKRLLKGWDGFAGVEFNEQSTHHLSECEVVNIDQTKNELD